MEDWSKLSGRFFLKTFKNDLLVSQSENHTGKPEWNAKEMSKVTLFPLRLTLGYQSKDRRTLQTNALVMVDSRGSPHKVPPKNLPILVPPDPNEAGEMILDTFLFPSGYYGVGHELSEYSLSFSVELCVRSCSQSWPRHRRVTRNHCFIKCNFQLLWPLFLHCLCL